LIGIGKKMKRKVIAVITAMEQPLGMTVGNALEVKEAIDTLKGNGPEDLTNLCLELGAHMLVLAKVVKNHQAGVKKLEALIASGAAFEKFKTFVKIQGGDLKQIEKPNLLPKAKFSRKFNSPADGYLSQLNAEAVGLAAMNLGGGRVTKESIIDYSAGIVLKKKMGDKVKKGETIAIMHTNNKAAFIKAKKLLDSACKISRSKPKSKPLILKVIK